MIVHFPTLEILRLALTLGSVPEKVRQAPARAGWDEDDNTWVVTPQALPGPVQAELRRLGVLFPDEAPVPLDRQVLSWPQLLPVARDPRPLNVGERTPILFEMPSDQAAAMIDEMLRLGNDRQALRWIETGGRERALLRVLGPPYYTLLRALDGAGADDAPVAYAESTPGVWCQLGYRHVQGEHLRPPANKVLLLRPPRAWVLADEARFRDIYDVLEFTLPAQPATFQASDTSRRFQVSLRLANSSGAEAAELWLLKGEGIAQLEQLVQTADNVLVQRLAFAVAERGGERLVVVRARPSRQPPPVLVLEALGLRAALRLPNLFVPVGKRLHPPLRRDVVARLLAPDAAQITWLNPGPDGTFTPETLPDTAFRPLDQWVDYIVDHEHQALTAWMGLTRFDFEAFVCRDDDDVEKKPRPPRSTRKGKDDKSTPEIPTPKVKTRPGKKREQTGATAEEVTLPAPSELERELRDLEGRFLDLEGPLDAPERHALWPRLAALQGALGHEQDASVSWCTALWDRETPPDAWAEQWLGHSTDGLGFSLEKTLARPAPTHADLRRLVAYLVWSMNAPERGRPLQTHLGPTQHFLQRHEALLGVRAVWLAWVAIYRLTHDALALARARDRLLERLFVDGLSPQLDLPAFLRFAGARSARRFHVRGEQIARLRQMVLRWADTGSIPGPGTAGYIRLIFAFALARLGAASDCRDALSEALQFIPNRDQVHDWLCDAYAARIEQALDNKVHSLRLPEALLARLDALETPAYLQHLSGPPLDREKSALKVNRYKVDKLRAHSRILEPHERIDPYRRWHGHFDDALARTLALLMDVHDGAVLIARLRELLGDKKKLGKAKKANMRILAAALELAPRLGDEFAGEVLARLGEAFREFDEPGDLALVLEKGVYLAAHFDRRDEVRRLLDHLRGLLEATERRLSVGAVETLLGKTFEGLRRLGMRDEVGRLLESMGALMHYHQEELVRKTAKLPVEAASKEISGLQGLLLQVASGWFQCDRSDQARPLLDEARDLLLREELTPFYQTALARNYCQALGQAPFELAFARLMEVFRRLKGVRDMFTTHTHFSVSRLEVVEAAVLALVGDESAHDPQARRLLDEDEYLVRRRLHRDVRAALA